MPTLDEIRTQFTALHTKNKSIIDKATEEGREFTAEEKTETDANFAKMETFKKLEDQNAKLAAFKFCAGDVENPADPVGKEETHAAEIIVGETRVEQFLKKPENRQAFKHALSKWASTGQFPQSFATITTATASGALLPKDVMPVMVPSALNTVRQIQTVWGLEALSTPTTRDISFPIATAAAGSTVSETANAETENEAGLSPSILLHCSTYQSGSTWISNLELNAGDYDLFSALLPALQYSKELALESGVISAIAADTNITQKVTLATGSGLSGFVYSNLTALNRALPKRYSGMNVIVLSKQAYIAAENLVTTTGFPILNQDAQNQSLKRFNGTPVLWSDYLSPFGANNVIGFIASNLGFKLRDAGQNEVQRYTQTPSRPAQTGFNLYGYHAAGYDPAAMALLVCPAS